MEKNIMRKPPITFENRMDIIKKSFITIAIVMSINFTASSVTFAQESKGYAPVNGLKLYYEVYGTAGVPLVLIHGGGSTIESSFGNILPLLVKHSKVIALELQAHGRTSDRDGALSFQQDADDVVGLLQYLKIDKADFFGFS
ncbi:MAG TPA: alpha/beta hydrolase, partial [Bacteroidales bacterium]